MGNHVERALPESKDLSFLALSYLWSSLIIWNLLLIRQPSSWKTWMTLQKSTSSMRRSVFYSTLVWVLVTFYLSRFTNFLVYMNLFPSQYFLLGQAFAPFKPARSAVEVARLPRDVLVEIECIAAVKNWRMEWQVSKMTVAREWSMFSHSIHRNQSFQSKLVFSISLMEGEAEVRGLSKE